MGRKKGTVSLCPFSLMQVPNNRGRASNEAMPAQAVCPSHRILHTNSKRLPHRKYPPHDTAEVER